MNLDELKLFEDVFFEVRWVSWCIVEDEKGLQGQVILTEIFLDGRTKDQIYPLHEKLPGDPRPWVSPPHNLKSFFENFML